MSQPPDSRWAMFSRIGNIAASIVSQGLLVIAFLLTYEVFARTFGGSVRWLGDLSRYIMVWVVFVFIGIGFLRGGHIRAGVLPRRVATHPVIARLLSIIEWVAFMLIGSFWLVLGSDAVTTGLETGQRTVGGLRAQIWMLHLAVPVGGVVILGAGVVLAASRSRRPSAPKQTMS